MFRRAIQFDTANYVKEASHAAGIRLAVLRHLRIPL